MTRGLSDLLADLAEAVDAAAELVMLGKERWDAERPLRLAGEAVIGRLGDIATKLPAEVTGATPEIPWREVKACGSLPLMPITASTTSKSGSPCAMRCLLWPRQSSAGPRPSLTSLACDYPANPAVLRTAVGKRRPE